MGLKAEASALYAVAIGGWHKDIGATTASGIASLATGLGSQATAPYAAAIGQGPQAKSFCGVAIGHANSTEGMGAVSFGRGTKAQGAYSFVIGKYNIPETNLTYSPTAGYGYTDGNQALIIGNGTADDARSNALTVDWNGNTTIAGSLTLNGTTTITATDVSNWNNSSIVSISPTLTSGTKIGTITIDGTNTDLYCQTNTDTKTRQTLYSNNDNLPLLMSYQTASDTTTYVDNITYRNNSIYANPSTGTITTPNETITNKLTINTLVGNSATYGDTLPATGVEGQIFFKKLSSS